MSDETNRLLYEILLYSRAQAIAAVRPNAKAILNTPQKCLVYSLMDGKHTQKQIVDETKIPQATVSSWMISFLKSGIAVPANDYYDGSKALFTLDELGIEPSTLKKAPAGPEVAVVAKEQ